MSDAADPQSVTSRRTQTAAAAILVAAIILGYLGPDRTEVAKAAVMSSEEIDLLALYVRLDPPLKSKPKAWFPMSDKDVECMTDNIYHEARGEGVEGWKGVMTVTVNRVRDRRWKNTVCGVVYESFQFSWANGLKGKRKAVRDKKLWRKIEASVRTWSVTGYPSDVATADHYHASYVRPKWSKSRKMRYVGRIGAHLYYDLRS